MNLQQVEYAVAVLEAGSIVGAARACRVTQPTLTQQLRKLEEELGGALFERGRHPLRPTALGRKLLPAAQRLRQEASALRALAAAGDGRPRGVLRLGILPSVAGTLLPRVLPAFLQGAPELRLRTRELPTAELLRALRDGSLDAGVAAVPLEAPGLAKETLYREGFVAYLPPRHALLAAPRTDPAALAKERLLVLGEGHCVRHQVLKLCRRPGEAGLDLESGSFATLVALVDRGLGVTVLPELVAEDLPPASRARVRPLEGAPAVREVALLRVRPSPRDAELRLFARAVRAAVPPGPSGRVLGPGVREA